MDVLLNEIANSGPWGPLLALSIGGNVWLVRRLLAEKDKRILDALAVRNNFTEPFNYIKSALTLINDKVQVSKERS